MLPNYSFHENTFILLNCNGTLEKLPSYSFISTKLPKNGCTSSEIVLEKHLKILQ